MAKALLGAVFYRRLPRPTPEEEESLGKLQNAFREFTAFETRDALPSETAWLNNMNRLRELVLSHSPRRFLRWDVVCNTMYVAYARYISKELKYLKSLPDWRTRWRAAIKESLVGDPIPYLWYWRSSGTLIHHTYHLGAV
jgi:hypothetical protein